MKEISQKQLEEKISYFENKGWRCCNGSDSFKIVVTAYSPTKYYWSNDEIKERREKGILFEESKEAQRYINLIKIHFQKYPQEWSDVKRNF